MDVIQEIDVAHRSLAPENVAVGTLVYARSQVVNEYFLMRVLKARIHPLYCRVTFANDDEMRRYLNKGGERVINHRWDRLAGNMYLAMDINDIDYWLKEREDQ